MMRILARHFPRSFALVLLVPLAAAAQPETNGRLTGTVMDQQGGVVPRAAVSAKNDRTESEFRPAGDGIRRTAAIQDLHPHGGEYRSDRPG